MCKYQTYIRYFHLTSNFKSPMVKGCMDTYLIMVDTAFMLLKSIGSLLISSWIFQVKRMYGLNAIWNEHTTFWLCFTDLYVLPTVLYVLPRFYLYFVHCLFDNNDLLSHGDTKGTYNKIIHITQKNMLFIKCHFIKFKQSNSTVNDLFI